MDFGNSTKTLLTIGSVYKSNNDMMTKEDKDLLLKDLCGRLPYGVKCKCEGTYGIENEFIAPLLDISLYRCIIGGKCKDILDVKPCLFPLSSMTEEQRVEYSNTFDLLYKFTFYPTSESFDWLNANHFDYRGLIEKGLALDATNLNIY